MTLGYSMSAKFLLSDLLTDSWQLGFSNFCKQGSNLHFISVVQYHNLYV